MRLLSLVPLTLGKTLHSLLLFVKRIEFNHECTQVLLDSNNPLRKFRPTFPLLDVCFSRCLYVETRP